MPAQPQIAPDLFAMQARYNTWFNRELARAAAQSHPPELLIQLNHLHVMDCLWLHRFGVRNRALPPPRAMDEARFMDTRTWYRKQAVADRAIEDLVARATIADLRCNVAFTTMADARRVSCPLWALLAHLFNHQTLHRGEILCLLRMHGIGFGQSDLLPFSPLTHQSGEIARDRPVRKRRPADEKAAKTDARRTQGRRRLTDSAT